MEVEMKAKITLEQAADLVDGKFGSSWWSISRGGGWHAIAKKDEYYSFDGIVPVMPKTVIRLRTEASIGDTTSFEEIVQGQVKSIKDDFQAFLTVKNKRTDENGIETNDEFEGALQGEAFLAFNKVLEAANFKTYFEKQKTSVSFWCEKNGHEIHCEIVNVNGIGPYLEVEAFVSENPTDMCEYKTVEEAQKTIKDFFKSSLKITKFDKRSWMQIIAEEK